MESKDALVLALSTAPDLEAAERIANALVERRLAACVNLVPGVTSIYRWRGALERASEVLLVLKTRASLVPELERGLRAVHPYEVPEFVVVATEHVAAAYAAWVSEETGAPGG